MVIDLTDNQINAMLKGTLKLTTKDYIIYKREWLEDNLDNEVKLIKSHAEARKKGIQPFNRFDLDNYLTEQQQEFIDKWNEVGNPGYIVPIKELNEYLKENKDES